MKLVAIGDIHGWDTWKKIIEQEPDADKFVFIGDYFDSFRNKPIVQIANFKQILEFKRANPEKVELLIGNHDYHYIPGISERYSGYSNTHWHEIENLMYEALKEDLLNICYRYNDYFFSHAGITETWLERNSIIQTEDLDKTLNDEFKSRPRTFVFSPGRKYDAYGDEINQCPLWVRPRSLEIDGIKGYTFIIGHTQVEKVTRGKNYINIDALCSGQYLVINEEDNEVKTIKEHKITFSQ